MTETTAEVPFDVTDGIAVGDLNEVQNQITPQGQNVKIRIAKANVKPSKAGDLKSLNCEFKIVDGIMIDGEPKYQGKSIFPSFMDILVWADPATKVSPWYKSKQHLMGFKEFCKALDIELSSVTVNDEFIANLIGRELTCNIVHEAETSLSVDPDTGKQERVKTGQMNVKLKNFRKAI